MISAFTIKNENVLSLGRGILLPNSLRVAGLKHTGHIGADMDMNWYCLRMEDK